MTRRTPSAWRKRFLYIGMICLFGSSVLRAHRPTSAQQDTLALTQDTLATSNRTASNRQSLDMQRIDTPAFTLPRPPRYYNFKRDVSVASLPLLTLGASIKPLKRDIRKVNHDLNEGFHKRFDDYTQYSPLVATYLLKAFGVEGRSQWGRLVASNALSALTMGVLVNGLKYSVKEMRPDGSTRNSFPSGHTATAFMAATILHKEYGATRYPWISAAGYAVATGIGVTRVLNNRHWASDVLTGAGIGILSTELGYWFTDLLLGDRYTLRREIEGIDNTRRHPSYFGLQMGASVLLNHLSVPPALQQVHGPTHIHAGVSTTVGAEVAYFFTPYWGVGGRLRIASTAMTPEWKNGEKAWTYGTMAYDPVKGRYEKPAPGQSTYRTSDQLRTDQLSSFTYDVGAYAQYPFHKRWAVGGKIMLGARRTGQVWYYGNVSARTEEDGMELMQKAFQMTEDNQIIFYDKLSVMSIEGTRGFNFSTGLCLSYAVQRNICWKLHIGYDLNRMKYRYTFGDYYLSDILNYNEEVDQQALAGQYTEEQAEQLKEDFLHTYSHDPKRYADISLRRTLHSLNVNLGLCFAF